MAKNEQVQTVVFNGENVIVSLEGTTLCIRMDATKRLRPSRPTIDKNGKVHPPKSMIIGTTGGNKPITLPDGTAFRLGVTAYVPNQAEGVVAE